MKRILAIETGIEPEYEEALQAAAWNHGWTLHSVQNIPFTDRFITGSPRMGDPLPEELLQNPNVWFHGSIQAAKRAQAVTAWKVHAPWDSLRCTSYYPVLRERILQKHHRFTTLDELPQIKEELFEEVGQGGHLFIRPDGNDKTFTGGVVSLDEFQKGYELMTFYEPPGHTKIVVAAPQNIKAEARFLVVGGEIITGSYYRTGGQTIRLEATESLMETARDMLQFCLNQGYNPSPSWVLDLAQTTGGWSIIEVGASSCCGLYKCDLEAFIEALEEVL